MLRKRGRGRGRGGGGLVRVPPPYFRFGTYMYMREQTVMLTHLELAPMFQINAIAETDPFPAYMFQQNYTAMMRLTSNSVPTAVSAGDPRNNMGAHTIFSLTAAPYASLWNLLTLGGVRVAVNPSESAPAAANAYVTDFHIASRRHAFVQCLSMRYTWFATYLTDNVQFTVVNEPPPNDVIEMALQPKHRRAQIAWFRESALAPDPLTASGLLQLLYFDGETATAPPPDALSLKPWTEFQHLKQTSSYRFVNRGSCTVLPRVGVNAFTSATIAGVVNPTAGAVAALTTAVQLPNGGLHPGVSSGLMLKPIGDQNTYQALRILLGGGFLHFYVPAVDSVYHTVVQAALPAATAESLDVLRAVPPCAITLRRVTRFKFFDRRPLGPDYRSMLSPDANVNGRWTSLRTSRWSFPTNYNPFGPPFRSTADGVVVMDFDGHAPMA